LWESKYLRTSFRVTGNIARFVNEALLGYQKIVPFKDPGEKVDYYVGDTRVAVQRILKQLVSDIKNELISPGDVFVLAPSIKSNPKSTSPIKVV
jgi:hypothetical protein